MPRYIVLSPEYDVKLFMLDDGTGPSEGTRLVVELDAPNKKQAVRVAVKAWRDNYGASLPYCESDENPYKGVRAYLPDEDEPLPFDDATPAEVDAPAEDTALLDELDALSE